MTDENKGEWAETAEEGVVPDKLSGDDQEPPVGRTTGTPEPATEEGIDRTAGDEADATAIGGQKPPENAEPDLKDVGEARRQADAG